MPSPATEVARYKKAYRIATKADAAFQRELVKVYGKRAGEMRYHSHEHTGRVKRLGDRYVKASLAMSEALKKMRAAGGSVNNTGKKRARPKARRAAKQNPGMLAQLKAIAKSHMKPGARYIHYRDKATAIDAEELAGKLNREGVSTRVDQVRTRLLPTPKYKYEVWADKEQAREMLQRRSAVNPAGKKARKPESQKAPKRQNLNYRAIEEGNIDPFKQTVAYRKALLDLLERRRTLTGFDQKILDALRREFPASNPSGAKGPRAVREFFGTHDIDIIFNAQPERAMRILSERHGKGHGVEHIDSKEFTRKAPGRAYTRGLDYVNMGDPYTTTLMHDGENWRLGSWGDFVEKYGKPAQNPGGESAFDRCVKAVSKRKGVVSPRGLCAAIGRKKYGAAAFAQMAAAGRNPKGGEELRAFKKFIRAYKNPVASVGAGSAIAHVSEHDGEFVARTAGDKPQAFDKFKAAMEWAKRKVGLAKNNALAMATAEQLIAGKQSIVGKLQRKLAGNPKAAAEKMYEIFHGIPAAKVIEYRGSEHVHEWLWGVGTLISIVVKNARGQSMTLRAPDPDGEFEKVVMVCCTEDGKQIYFRGGDQSLPLDDLLERFGMGEDDVRDVMKMGAVSKLTYRTRKNFEGKGEVDIDFYHFLGKEHAKGVLPDLIYKPLNPSLELAGGRYKVGDYDKQLEASPGIVG